MRRRFLSSVYHMQAGVLRQLPDGGAEAVERVSRVLTAAPSRPVEGVPDAAVRPRDAAAFCRSGQQVTKGI